VGAGKGGVGRSEWKVSWMQISVSFSYQGLTFLRRAPPLRAKGDAALCSRENRASLGETLASFGFLSLTENHITPTQIHQDMASSESHISCIFIFCSRKNQHGLHWRGIP
jgi:hypothetical protein